MALHIGIAVRAICRLYRPVIQAVDMAQKTNRRVLFLQGKNHAELASAGVVDLAGLHVVAYGLLDIDGQLATNGTAAGFRGVLHGVCRSLHRNSGVVSAGHLSQRQVGVSKQDGGGDKA